MEVSSSSFVFERCDVRFLWIKHFASSSEEETNKQTNSDGWEKQYEVLRFVRTQSFVNEEVRFYIL